MWSRFGSWSYMIRPMVFRWTLHTTCSVQSQSGMWAGWGAPGTTCSVRVWSGACTVCGTHTKPTLHADSRASPRGLGQAGTSTQDQSARALHVVHALHWPLVPVTLGPGQAPEKGWCVLLMTPGTSPGGALKAVPCHTGLMGPDEIFFSSLP